MKNINVLPIIYKDIMGKEIDINNEDNRDILQKLVYLLGELRIFVEEYKFTYDKNVGPFSQSLENDIMEINVKNMPFDELTANSNDAISYLKEVVDQNNGKYSERAWLENIASQVYMKKYMYPSESFVLIRHRVCNDHKDFYGNDTINTICSGLARTIIILNNKGEQV